MSNIKARGHSASQSFLKNLRVECQKDYHVRMFEMKKGTMTLKFNCDAKSPWAFGHTSTEHENRVIMSNCYRYSGVLLSQ